MPENRTRHEVTTGVPRLDQVLGGIFIGDNVVWYDDSGSLASVFWLRFIRASLKAKKPVIFASFDRSPKNLFERLGELGKDENLTVLDCFTYGKGKGIPTFLKFMDDAPEKIRRRIIPVAEPGNTAAFSDALYELQARLPGDVRIVFESLTGMQELWGGEDEVIRFYSQNCPRLYDLSTIAYWVMEKSAHSRRLRAQISHIAQVAVELSIKRGTTSLSVVKAEDRQPMGGLQQPHRYQTRGLEISFAGEKDTAGTENLGSRIKRLRARRGQSQAELARLVGVTPSTISQVESNTIYPSIPGLVKMAEVMGVEPGYFFGPAHRARNTVHRQAEAPAVRLGNLPAFASARQLTPLGEGQVPDAYLLEVPPGTEIAGHFLACKGWEAGFMAEGSLTLHFPEGQETAEAGDFICITDRLPSGWSNPGPETARILWIKLGESSD
ncbi:MAG: helix-turn-helix domain-containing protein [Proteobacteria bacterium]|nr:helix-turn-helix domain-containing protein [Pseudomonadota bacterium]